jgi:hypothetical protein
MAQHGTHMHMSDSNATVLSACAATETPRTQSVIRLACIFSLLYLQGAANLGSAALLYDASVCVRLECAARDGRRGCAARGA